jgi:hypothetical protein
MGISFSFSFSYAFLSLPYSLIEKEKKKKNNNLNSWHSIIILYEIYTKYLVLMPINWLSGDFL